MKGIFKNLIIATIPFAIAMSGGAAGLVATLQGVEMWFMLAVSIGAGVYIGVVIHLLTIIERYDSALVKAYERTRLERLTPRRINHV